ncbi:Protein of unknown function [Paenibacillus sp. UNCCL117]|uniref:DUF1524 domain-containing protein n=1 Tax=unclassified Paenibacillus TaxID=185978 RepID=UPI0008817169|nr:MULTISPECIES: DUF1524 domain-containing protein [unclassified Paenibacillus]SDE47177.1 Protein of unknown function [Paenibacillus sp. cl123]SFW65739.1 Protein of unknown function [Paenibacillus sp. UNCCL117]
MSEESKFQEELDVLARQQAELDTLKRQTERLSSRVDQSHAELRSYHEQGQLGWEVVTETKPLKAASSPAASWEQLVNAARAGQARKAQYSDFLTDQEIQSCVTMIRDMRQELKEQDATRLVEELKDGFLGSLIGPFGLSLDMLRAFDGGAIPTVHNANKGIIPHDKDGERLKDYQSKYDRDNYAPQHEMNKSRKARFQDEAPLVDGYTNKPLERDGSSHIEHIVSASELHGDDWARLFVSTEKRKEFVNSEENLTWTGSSLNQSKSDRDLLEWMQSPSKKDPTKTNAEYYEVDQEKARALYAEASRKRKNMVYGKVAGEVLVQCGKTSVKMGLRKMLGYILYELAQEVFKEVRDLLRKKRQQAVQLKQELADRLKRIAQAMLSKWKEVLKQFADGAIAGFISELLIFLINQFVTTMKRLVRIIKEGIMSLVGMIRFVLNPPKDMLREEVYQQCLKMGATILVTSGGILLEEAVEKFLTAQVWLAPFAGLLAPIVTGLLTGLVLSLVMFGLDKLDLFGAKEKKLDQQLSQRIMDDLWALEAELGAMAAG